MAMFDFGLARIKTHSLIDSQQKSPDQLDQGFLMCLIGMTDYAFSIIAVTPWPPAAQIEIRARPEPF